jgi:hypothetical protein
MMEMLNTMTDLASATVTGATTEYATLPDGTKIPVVKVQRPDGTYAYETEAERARASMDQDTFMARFADTQTVPQEWTPETQAAIRRFRHIVPKAMDRLMATVVMTIGDPHYVYMNGMEDSKKQSLLKKPDVRDILVATMAAIADADGNHSFWKAVIQKCY